MFFFVVSWFIEIILGVSKQSNIRYVAVFVKCQVTYDCLKHFHIHIFILLESVF